VLHVRLTSEEWHDIAAAAARAGLKPTAYAGEAAVAAARALVVDGGTGATRAQLAVVQREVFAARSALVQAVQVSCGGPDPGLGEIGATMVGHLDAIAERLHVLLKRASS
jgi:multidrug efflux pump subunit AcrA (membrane-fusion protein)